MTDVGPDGQETGARSGLRVSRSVAASPGWVYRALTDPDLLREWWWPWQPVAETDPRQGGAYRLAAENPRAGHIEVGGRYLDVRHDLLRFTWRWLGAPEADDTTVTIEITPSGTDASALVVLHEGFADQATRDDHVQGWDDCLDRLVALAAVGQPEAGSERNASTSPS